MKRRKYLYHLLILFLLVSCTSKNLNPPIDFKKENLNNQINLHILDYANNFTTEKPIILELTYDYKNEFNFPNNYNIRIFSKTSDGWVELSEIPTDRIPAGDVILSPNVDIPYPYVISVLPKIPDNLQKYNLRIYVSGQMVNNEEITDVAAFIDVNLIP